MPTAHYDGVAAWYDEHLAPGSELVDVVRLLVGSGPGRCLDLGCGTGFHLETLHGLDWTVSGIDISEDQLDRARERAGDFAELLHGDATALPFADGSFDLVFSGFTHTDVDDFGAAVVEAVRVLAPAGRLVYAGPHPCFIGPHSRFPAALGVPELHPGYLERGRYLDGVGVRPEGLRARVGAVHLTLGDLLQAFLHAGLRIEAFEEPVEPPREYPHWLALRAVR
ncbi:MAG TPA: methyltransferase domain-containing protein [Gaiellaceae bacterium]|nr:methyltransferase domain-containing protein [Gaiellaceae bacterium]